MILFLCRLLGHQFRIAHLPLHEGDHYLLRCERCRLSFRARISSPGILKTIDTEPEARYFIPR